MIAQMQRMKILSGVVVALAYIGGATAAEPTKADCPAPSKEAREKMAVRHEEMAACLRSDKPLAECHADLMKDHSQMMEQMGCPGRKMHPHGNKPPQTSTPK